MPHQTTDRDFPQDDDSAHARIIKASIPLEAQVVFEIARQVISEFSGKSISSDLLFQMAVEMAFLPANYRGLMNNKR